MDYRVYMAWLHSIPGVGDKTLFHVVECLNKKNGVDNGRILYDIVKDIKWKEKQLEYIKQFGYVWFEEFLQKQEKEGIKFVLYGEKEYPDRLKDISDPPFLLYWKGNLPEQNRKTVAMIGARECSIYGKELAKEFGKKLAESGINVVSGMARGIDGISQMATVEAGGKTYAVLGSGVDVCYPRENRMLYDKITENGGILSQYPLGMEPKAQNFPMRNRIISGLSDAVLVIEAKKKSGTMITVDMALEQGRDVYAVPGRITDRFSEGCNGLLSQGASIITSADDFIMDMSGGNDLSLQCTKDAEMNLDKGHYTLKTDMQKRIIKILGQKECTIDEICSIMEENLQKDVNAESFEGIMETIAMMHIGGMIKYDNGRYYI